eukprot:353935-Chlamydomonas_euryale.AAC.5
MAGARVERRHACVERRHARVAATAWERRPCRASFFGHARVHEASGTTRLPTPQHTYLAACKPLKLLARLNKKAALWDANRHTAAIAQPLRCGGAARTQNFRRGHTQLKPRHDAQATTQL